MSPGGDCSAAAGEGRDAAAVGRRLILIITVIFSTVQLPPSLLYTKALSVIQRDAAIPANLSQDTRAGLCNQHWKKLLAEVAKKPFPSLLAVIY